MKRWIFSLLGIFVFVLFLFSRALIDGYIDWLWFVQLGFGSVFIKLISIKVVIAALFGLLFFVILGINLLITRKLNPKYEIVSEDEIDTAIDRNLIGKYINKVIWGILILFSFLTALNSSINWETFLFFFNPSSFGKVDPLFGKDIGFYVFQLPMLRYLQGWFLFVVGFSLVTSALVYFLQRNIRITFKGPVFDNGSRAHLAILSAFVFGLFAYGFQINMYDLLFSPRGVVFGAGYTDIHATLPALRILQILTIVAGLTLLINIYKAHIKYTVFTVGFMAVVAFLGLVVYPSLVQNLQVMPNEIAKESPYIRNNIEFTRLAFGLDKVKSFEFPAEENLTLQDIQKNEATVKSIRLWDHKPLRQTYGQLQEIRTYYDFHDIDNDRYYINGKYQQTMLSPRELSSSSLPSKIWINERLTYTHGYGVCFGPVNKVTKEGLPEFFVKDIPPVSSANIKVTRPEIYYGEMSNDYVIVNTKSKEFDYPSGNENVYTHYKGRGGVPIHSFLRKVLFAIKFGSTKIILSSDINNKSRVMYNRTITERFNKLAPFLKYDTDPYMIVDDKGKLFWIIDGYTTTSNFPYSHSYGGLGNYIKNSVKCVIDAYNGDVTLYIVDEKDPLIQTYSRIFPDLFTPSSKMPKDIRAHLRYPITLFEIQANIYSLFHMDDPQIFYNREDLWSIPRSSGSGEIPIEPYYTIMKLSGEKKEEFILMLPFTPARKDNLAAWMAIRNDYPNYGQIIVYKFPKKKLIYGPKQIDARINQEPDISRQISLWDQRGSEVIRGSLMVIPIDKSILYVQSLYIKSDQSSMPELKRVIASYGSHIVMEQNLDKALSALFGGEYRTKDVATIATTKAPVKNDYMVVKDQNRIAKIVNALKKAKEAQRKGDWTEYGRQWKILESNIMELEGK